MKDKFDEKDTAANSPENEAAEACASDTECEQAAPAADDVSELLAQLDKAQEQTKAAEDRALRAVADLDNYRRRMAREMQESRMLANAALIEDLLPALDNFRLGMTAAANHPEAADVAKGFEVVASQLQQILAQHGLVVLEPAAGDDFDHNEHEAVSQQPSDDIADDKVVTLVRAGYKLNERLLRPASVVVSSGPAA